MTVVSGGRRNLRVRAFTGENLNIRVFRRRQDLLRDEGANAVGRAAVVVDLVMVDFKQTSSR
jgi:hypothetical protein